MQAARLEPVPLPGLRHEMGELVLDGCRKDQAGEAGRGIAGSHQLAQFASGGREQRRLSRLGSLRALSGVRPGAQLLGEPAMPLLVLGRSELHGEVEEAGLVPFCVALDEPDELLRGGHGLG
ncbi:hypothetical protein D3C87_1552620 [compost metagenome]